MLSVLRAISETWLARLLFFALAASFVVWGISSRSTFGGGGNAAATVGGTTISAQELQQTYRKQIQQVTQQMGGKADLPPGVRQQVAMQSIEQLVTQAALQSQVRQLGLAVPDQAVLEAAHQIQAFQDSSGHYSPPQMQRVLAANGYTEASFVDLLRRDLGSQQLLTAVQAGATAPRPMLTAIYRLQHETRVADIVSFPFADAPAPAPPSEAQLHRWYDNHPKSYTSPEYRRIRAVILDPETIEKEIPVPDSDLRAAYNKRKDEFAQPERRTVQVLTLPNQAAAQKLDTAWIAGADWETIRKQAEAAGGTSTELSSATKAEFPSPELGEAAFATPSGSVSAPVKSGLGGWYVVRVVQVDAASTKSFEQVRDELRQPIAADKAADILDQRATQLDDDLQSGRTFDDQLAGNPIAEQGTLDAKGMTLAGNPAPLRGSAALRSALIAAAFQAHPGDPLKLERVPTDTPRGLPSYYAVQVVQIIPPAVRPYDQVADQVRTDWLADQRRRAQDAAAANLMTAVQGGKPMQDAAAAIGKQVTRLPPVTRAGGVEQVPEKLTQLLFTLRKGDTTMVETPTGFLVAQLAQINDPDPSADKLGTAALQDQLDRSVAGDIQNSFVVAARNRARPDINRAVVQQLVQAGE